MKKGILVLLFIMLGFYISAQDYTGREIATGGSIATIEGVLVDLDGEIYIKVEETLYQIHLGPEEYSESIGFRKEGGFTASVNGYLLDEHIAPINIIVENKTYQFWGLDGRPMWSGQSYTGGKGEEGNDHEH